MGSVQRLIAQASLFAKRQSAEELRRTLPIGEAAYKMFDVAKGVYRVVAPRHRLHRRERIAPVLVVGAGRSGTTLLRRVVSGHPDVHLPPESRLVHTIRIYQRNAHLPWHDLVLVTLGSFVFNNQFSDFEMTLTGVAQSLSRLPRRERSLARIVDAVYAKHAKHAGKPGARWGDKTPSNCRFLPRIHAAFPEAQILHIVRDGADVIPSAVRAGFRIDLAHSALRWRRDATDAARWCEAHPHQSHTIRYEALVAQPEKSAREIATFLGLPYSPEMLLATRTLQDVSHRDHHQNVSGPIVTSSIGKGRASMSIQTRAELGPLVNDALLRFGYPAL